MSWFPIVPTVKRLPLSRNTILFIYTFIFEFGMDVLSFSLIYIWTDRFALSPGQIGASLALGSGCYLLGCNIYQIFCGKWKPKYIITGAMSSIIIAVLFLAFTPRAWGAIGAWCVIQFSTAFFWPPVMTWFTQELNESDLNRDISWFNRSWMTGSLLGPYTGGLLYRRNSAMVFVTVLFCFFLILSTLALLIVFTETVRYDTTIVQGKGSQHRGQAQGIPEFQARKIRRFKFLGWAGVACASLLAGVINNVVPLYIRDTLGYSETIASVVRIVRSLAGIIAFIFFARYTFWHFNRRWFMVLQGSLIVFSLVLAMSGSVLFLYFVAAFASGFFYSGAYNNSIFHSGADKTNPGRNMAFHEISIGLGNAAGTLCGGYCFQYAGIAGTFFVIAVIQAAGFAVQAFLGKKV